MGDSGKWKGYAGTAPFLRKTYDMVDDPTSDSVVSWSPNNSSFVIWNLPQLVQDLLPKYFKHRNFSSFVRQLNTYGFRKVPERWEFANEGFVKGQKHLLKSIARRKPVQGLPNDAKNRNNNDNDNDNDCIEVGSFGIQQEVEGLIKDKNVLSQQLVRLRKLQQSTDTRLHSVSQRVQLMDQTQQQMMSFLAIAMHSPALLSQLVHTQNDANLTKKRSLPTPDDDDDGGGGDNALGLTTLRDSRQVLKYQPLINEAAKAMLRQILKLNAQFPDHYFKDSNSFLLDLLPAASDVTDNANSAGRVSGLTLSEEPQTSLEPCFSTEREIRECSANYALGMNSKVHSLDSPLCVTSDSANGVGIPDLDVPSPLEDAIMSDLNQMQGGLPDSSLEFPAMTFSGTQDSALSFLDSLSSVQNETSPIEAPGCSPDLGAESDDILPGSNDAFWEQFFPVGPLSEATQEAADDPGEDEESEKLHQLNHLTEQLSFLTAEIGNV